MNNFYPLHEQSFLHYADSFIQKSAEPCLQLKKDHTFRVVANTRKLLSACSLSEEDAYCAQLIALYHDIGRFIQYEKYKTFVDKKSENHAYLAVRILKRHEPFLAEPEHIQKKVLAAVILHNSLELPQKLQNEYTQLCQIIRDADKLDILYIMAQNFAQSLPEKDSVLLHVKNDPRAYTASILQRAMNKQIIKYTDLVYENDFKILLCGWLFSLYFIKSREILKEQQYFSQILHSLPKDSRTQAFIDFIEQELNR